MIQLPVQLAAARDMVYGLRHLPLPGLYRGPILLVPAILIGVAAAGGAVLAGQRDPVGIAAWAGAGAGAVLAAAAGLWFVARGQVLRVWQPLGRPWRTPVVTGPPRSSSPPRTGSVR